MSQHLTFLEFTVFYCHGLTVFYSEIYGHFYSVLAHTLLYDSFLLYYSTGLMCVGLFWSFPPTYTLFSNFSDIGWGGGAVPYMKGRWGFPSSISLYMYLCLSQQMDPGEYWDAPNLLFYMHNCRHTHTKHPYTYSLCSLICFSRIQQLKAFFSSSSGCTVGSFLVVNKELSKIRAS